ncbi:MAG: putative ulk kinase [Streblomastix strix]|uniref:Putative ulk kinase n=1 Tax=Streblomastix strix TaxID=222440 RepID=A0A5J4V3Q1_9EUKA|nr:MAG: putative ulk kinase [Streblomastix strix]
MNDELILQQLDCRVLQSLGRGSFGRVYLVDPGDGKPHAAKVINRQDFNTREWEAASRLASLNLDNEFILKFDGLQQTTGCVVLLMEYANLQETLEDVVNAPTGPIAEEIVGTIILQILEGVRTVHSAGLVHRDLKPKHILMHNPIATTETTSDSTSENDPNNVVIIKLCDFSLARSCTPFDLASTHCGTPLYMAPEVLLGTGKFDQKADIWPIGIIMYQLLAKQHPFNIGSITELMQSVQSPLPTLENVSYLCWDLLTNLLQFHPLRRFTSEQALSHPFMQSLKENHSVLSLQQYRQILGKNSKPIRPLPPDLEPSGFFTMTRSVESRPRTGLGGNNSQQDSVSGSIAGMTSNASHVGQSQVGMTGGQVEEQQIVNENGIQFGINTPKMGQDVGVSLVGPDGRRMVVVVEEKLCIFCHKKISSDIYGDHLEQHLREQNGQMDVNLNGKEDGENEIQEIGSASKVSSSSGNERGRRKQRDEEIRMREKDGKDRERDQNQQQDGDGNDKKDKRRKEDKKKKEKEEDKKRKKKEQDKNKKHKHDKSRDRNEKRRKSKSGERDSKDKKSKDEKKKKKDKDNEQSNINDNTNNNNNNNNQTTSKNTKRDANIKDKDGRSSHKNNKQERGRATAPPSSAHKDRHNHHSGAPHPAPQQIGMNRSKKRGGATRESSRGSNKDNKHSGSPKNKDDSRETKDGKDAKRKSRIVSSSPLTEGRKLHSAEPENRRQKIGDKKKDKADKERKKDDKSIDELDKKHRKKHGKHSNVRQSKKHMRERPTRAKTTEPPRYRKNDGDRAKTAEPREDSEDFFKNYQKGKKDEKQKNQENEKERKEDRDVDKIVDGAEDRNEGERITSNDPLGAQINTDE